VYVIGELEHESASMKNIARSVLQQIADATGGQAFFPAGAKDLDAAYDKVLAEIRAQYTIGYQSMNAATDGAWRKVEIRLTGKNGRDYRVRARKGYFAYKK
jgi:Ca-activated chloride channel family protein